MLLNSARVTEYSVSSTTSSPIKLSTRDEQRDSRVSSWRPRHGLMNLFVCIRTDRVEASALIEAGEMRGVNSVSETFPRANLPPFPLSSLTGILVKLDNLKSTLANAVRTNARLPASSIPKRTDGFCSAAFVVNLMMLNSALSAFIILNRSPVFWRS